MKSGNHLIRDFINVLSRRGTGLHRRAKLFELNFFIGNLSATWSNQAGKNILTASQFAWCPAIDGTPDLILGKHASVQMTWVVQWPRTSESESSRLCLSAGLCHINVSLVWTSHYTLLLRPRIWF